MDDVIIVTCVAVRNLPSLASKFFQVREAATLGRQT